MRVGTDIVNIARVQRSIDRFGDRFKDKFLTKMEIDRAGNVSSIAGLWAAKEAISKALGCGIGRELSFLDIVIHKDDRGAPYFELSPKAQALHRVKSSSLSISHDGGFAIAVVVVLFFSSK